MKKLMIGLIFTPLFIILLPFLLSFGIRVIPGEVQPSLTTTERIYNNSVVAELFTAKRDNLNGIGVSLKNPNLQNKKEVVISLFDDSGQLLTESVVNGRSIPDGDFIKFIFRPILNSKGRSFIFILSSKLSDKSDAVEVFYTNEVGISKQKILDGKTFCLNKAGDSKVLMVDTGKSQDCIPVSIENNQKANVSFVTFYKVVNPVLITQEIYSGWWNRLYADKPFFVIYLVIISSLVVGLGLSAKLKDN